MTLTERYLKAVAAQLPQAERDDIIAELRDAIQTRMEDREEALGRPLTEAEEEAVLREVGHPLTVAARYGSGPMHVVGPEIYPWWMFAVKVALMALAVFTVLGLVARTIIGGDGFGAEIGHAIDSFIKGGLTLVGIATVAAYFIERQKDKPAFIRDWRVKDLGLFEIAAFDAETLSRSMGQGTDKPAKDRSAKTYGWNSTSMSPAARGVASAAAWAVFLLWWTGLLTTRALGPVDVNLDGVSYGERIVQTLALIYWPVVAYAAARIVFGLARAAAPASVRLTAAGDVLLSAARACLYGWLWIASPLSSVIRVDSLEAFISRTSTMMHTGDWGLAAILMLVVAIGFMTSLFEGSGALWRLVSGKPTPAGGWGRTRPA